jgi:hypothetical protein
VRPIKLFWWRHQDFTNFGDELSPVIVRAIAGRDVVRAPLVKSDLVAIGSVVQAIAPAQDRINEREKPLYVWGSGLIRPHRIVRHRSVHFVAVRGPCTREALGLPDDTPVGDPALLCDHVFPRPSKMQHAWGIVPHFSDFGSPLIQRIVASTPGAVLIDVREPDIAKVVRLIAACERIASTSLHGLIVADAFAIPNIRIMAGRIHGSPDWKFSDYFGSIRRHRTQAVIVPPSGNLDELSDAFETEHWLSLSAVKARLATSLISTPLAQGGALTS